MAHHALIFCLCFSRSLAVSTGEAFPCPIVQPAKLAPTGATDVHPAHVSVVMAMGDSITAAFAAESVFAQSLMLAQKPLIGEENSPSPRKLSKLQAAPLEFRDVSFSGGKGSPAHRTLPYVLSQYNTSLEGFATKCGYAGCLPQLPSTGYGKDKEVTNGLNVALTNAHSWQLSPQVAELKKQTQNVSNFDQRWKLLTIMIGANDLCDGSSTGFESCDGNATHAKYIVDRYESYVRRTLTDIRDSMKNIIVQVVSLFSISSVHAARGNSWYCWAKKKVLNECNCLERPSTGGDGKVSSEQLARFDVTNRDLNERLAQLTVEFNLQRPDFGVINIVTAKNQAIPDISWLSGLDCFHPSSLAHSAFATGLWNGMFHTDRVPAPLSASTPLFCPTSESVIHVPTPASSMPPMANLV